MMVRGMWFDVRAFDDEVNEDKTIAIDSDIMDALNTGPDPTIAEIEEFVVSLHQAIGAPFGHRSIPQADIKWPNRPSA